MIVTMGNYGPEIYLRQGVASGDWRIVVGNRRFDLPQHIGRLTKVRQYRRWFRKIGALYEMSSVDGDFLIRFSANLDEDRILSRFISK